MTDWRGRLDRAGGARAGLVEMLTHARQLGIRRNTLCRGRNDSA